MVDGKINKGEIILISEGEYSDYDICIIVKCLIDCDVREIGEIYLTANPTQRERFKTTQYINFLVNELKLFEEIEYREYHPCDYRGYIRRP